MKEIKKEPSENTEASPQEPHYQLVLTPTGDDALHMLQPEEIEKVDSTDNMDKQVQLLPAPQSTLAVEYLSRETELLQDTKTEPKMEDENAEAEKRDSKNTTPSFSSSSCSQTDSRIINKMREEKRQKIKDYLRELQTLVPLDKDQKSGTLSLLKEVLGRMKTLSKEQKVQGSNHSNSGQSSLSSRSRKSLSGLLVKSSEKRCLVTSHSSKRSTSDLSLGDFYVILTIDTGRIVDIGPGLLELLRFHKENLMNEEFEAFMHRSDMCTFRTIMSACHAMLQTSNSHIDESKSDETCSSDESGKIFFFRLRQYKSLVQRGFNLSNPRNFVLLRGIVNVKKSRLVDGGMHFGDPQHIVLDCSPVTSAYHSPNVPPVKRYFTTRHTMLCVYNFVDSAAVELLGYLPHDMIGTSIFDYYHPDDLPLILSAYHEVIKGKTIKTTPYRMRAKNGSYILVATELSSFFSVWSHKLELIISRHEVVQGPKDIAIFSDAVFKTHAATQMSLNEIAHLQCEIENLLLNSTKLPDKRFERTDTAVSCPGSEEKADITIDELVGTSQMAEIAEDSSQGKVKSKSFEVIENVMMKNRQERYMLYGQLNYAHTIKRYLMSQTLVSSEESEKRSSSPDEVDSAMLSDDLVDVGIPCMPKAPSFASSTKALVSEHEDAPHSPLNIPPPVEDLSNVIKEDVIIVTVPLTTASLVTPLTRESLSIHTKLMEEKYIMDFTRDQSSLLTSGQARPCLKGVAKFPSSDQSKGNTSQPSRKRMCTLKHHESSRKSDLCPPFPLTFSNSSYQVQSQSMFIQQMEHGQLGRPPGEKETNSHKEKAVFPSMMEGLSNPPVAGTSNSQDPSIQWPFYPQSGVPFMPQVMSGFVEAGESQGQQSKEITTAASNSYAKASHMIITSGASDDSEGQSHRILQQGDTSDEKDGSSVSFLLDLDELSQKSNTNVSSSNTEESVFKRPSCQVSGGPWLTNVRHKKDILMKYTIPKRTLSHILQNDKRRLRRMGQQPVVGVQFSMLLGEMEHSSPSQDEEADILFSIHQSQKTVTFCEPDSLESNSRKPLPQLRHKTPRKRLRESAPSANKKYSGKLPPLSCQPSFKPASLPSPIMQCMKSVKNQLQDSQESSGSPSLLDKNEESDASDVTRSEDRSNDEAGSSLKESDGSSFEGLKGSSKYTSSESELEQSENQQLPDQLFTNLNVSFSQLNQHLPHWLAEVNFSPHVQYRYKLQLPPLKELLEKDRKKLDVMTQPELLNAQVIELISEVSQHGDHNSDKGMSQSLSSDFGNTCKSSLTGSASDDKPSADSDPNSNDQKSVSRSDTSNNENELTEEQTEPVRMDPDKDAYFTTMNPVLDREFKFNEMKEVNMDKMKEQSKDSQSGSDKHGTESGENCSNNSNKSKMFDSTFMRGQEVESVSTRSSATSYPTNAGFLKKVFKTINEEDNIDMDHLVFCID